MELDQVLSPHASRERTSAPYPLVVEGTIATHDGEKFLRMDSAALIGPVTGADSLADGSAATVAISQEGIPYLIHPGSGGTGGGIGAYEQPDDPGTGPFGWIWIDTDESPPAPPSGGDLNYVHVQGTPSSVWIVTHNLGKYPSIEIVDSGGSAVIPSVQFDSPNAATLTFGSPTSGKAFCN
jgi:hypothetical protein